MNFLNIITLYVFIVCVIFILRYVIEFILNIKQENPDTIQIPPLNKLFLLGSSSYIITYIITLIIG